MLNASIAISEQYFILFIPEDRNEKLNSVGTQDLNSCKNQERFENYQNLNVGQYRCNRSRETFTNTHTYLYTEIVIARYCI